MICPKCGAEYRAGFTKCADCDVFLVTHRPASGAGEPPSGIGVKAGSLGESNNLYRGEEPVEPGDPNRDPFCSFWKGTDARICTELCTVLDEAGIPYKTVHRQDHLFNTANQVPYEVGVPASLYEKAELAIKEAFGTGEAVPSGQKLLTNGDELVNEFGTFSPWLKAAKAYAGGLAGTIKSAEEAAESTAEANEWLGPRYPEDATVEVWSGGEMDAKEMIEMSLHENDVMTRSEENAGQVKIFVLPEDEQRGREIVREIVESAPPE